MTGRILLVACLAAAGFTLPSSAEVVLIGDGIRNGFFSDTSNPTSNSGDAITTNGSGRALINSSNEGDDIGVANWRAFRRSYQGGNASFGWDGSTTGNGDPLSVGDIPYAFINAGEVEFIADPIGGAFGVGDLFNLSFGTFTVTPQTDHVVDVILAFDSGEEFSSSLEASDTAESTAFFDEDFILTQAASSVTLSLMMRSNSTDADGSGTLSGQFTMDNVRLSTIAAVPEPGTTGIACALLGTCYLRIRRRQ